MKTAIDTILERLDEEIKSITKDHDRSDRYWQTGIKHSRDIVMELKETEKQQIIEAYEKGADNYSGSKSHDYYTSTFNNQ